MYMYAIAISLARLPFSYAHNFYQSSGFKSQLLDKSWNMACLKLPGVSYQAYTVLSPARHDRLDLGLANDYLFHTGVVLRLR